MGARQALVLALSRSLFWGLCFWAQVLSAWSVPAGVGGGACLRKMAWVEGQLTTPPGSSPGTVGGSRQKLPEGLQGASKDQGRLSTAL